MAEGVAFSLPGKANWSHNSRAGSACGALSASCSFLTFTAGVADFELAGDEVGEELRALFRPFRRSTGEMAGNASSRSLCHMIRSLGENSSSSFGVSVIPSKSCQESLPKGVVALAAKPVSDVFFWFDSTWFSLFDSAAGTSPLPVDSRFSGTVLESTGVSTSIWASIWASGCGKQKLCSLFLVVSDIAGRGRARVAWVVEERPLDLFRWGRCRIVSNSTVPGLLFCRQLRTLDGLFCSEKDFCRGIAAACLAWQSFDGKSHNISIKEKA
jgi:hypothetical protein